MILRLLAFGSIIFALAITFSTCQAPTSHRTIEPSATPARAFLYKDEAPQPGLGAYGYLIFTMKPGLEQKEHYRLICESYARSLVDTSGYPGRSPASLMVTHWFIDANKGEALDSDNCDVLIQKYDYARATPIAQTVNKMAAKGPILVAWTTSYSSDLPVSSALVFDLSQFANEDLDRAFGIWKERIVNDPSVWNEGFEIVKIRESFRNLIQQYGEQVLAVIKPPIPKSK